ncbi:MAG: hypothetical protein H7Y15_05470, partial [Pseudonocardia sp.]|nr:hypothetical protein [Pseudonocardia sp.]
AAPAPAAFAVTVAGAPCVDIPVCTVTATVTNVGGSPAGATVFVSGTPGLPQTSRALGPIDPGATRSAPFRFGNPTPSSPTGRTDTVAIPLRALVHSAALHGPDPSLVDRLDQRGIGPTQQQVLRDLGPPYQPIALRVLDLMTTHAPVTDRAVNDAGLAALDNAIAMDLLPELAAIEASGRLRNPEDLARRVTDVGVETGGAGDREDQIGIRRAVEHVAEILRNDPSAEIIYDGVHVDRATGGRYTTDVIDVANTTSYQVARVGRSSVTAAVLAAAAQFEGAGGPDERGARELAPPGFSRTTIVFLEPPSRYMSVSKEDLTRSLGRLPEMAEALCSPSGRPRTDELAIVNSRGIHRWSSAEFVDLTGARC